MNDAPLKFGDYEVDVAAYELTRRGRSVRLERLPMELLLLLVERRGQLVTRDEIIEKLWGPGVFLDADNGINTAISKIRTALKDAPDDPAFVKTIPGKGYRFIAPIDTPPAKESDTSDTSEASEVSVVPKAPSKPRRWSMRLALAGLLAAATVAALSWSQALGRVAGRHAPPTMHALAVLPLENLTGDASQDYFADGMTDALITDLAQIGALRVISRTSIMRYKGTRKPLPEIARELSVDGIVEGTVVRSADRIRITSQLIYAPWDQHVWARSYERDLRDVVALQADVAGAIASEVRAVVTSDERTRLAASLTTHPDAYDAYLRGRYYLNQRTPAGMKKSLELFQQAVERDPDFALAHAGLADAYNLSASLGVLSPSDSAPPAKRATAKALALDPRLAEAHAALGLVKSHYDFDFPGAQREFARAIELNANYANAHLFYAGAYLTPMGRHEDAIAEMKKAIDLDPLSLPLHNMMGYTYMWAGNYENARQQFERTIALDPSFALAHFFFAGLLEATGRYEDAIDEIERGDVLLGFSPAGAAAKAAEFRQALHAGGERAFWQKNLDMTLQMSAKRGTRSFAVAAAYATAGDKDRAFEWLEKSYEDREGQDLTLVRWIPDFKNLRTDSRFASLLGKMGLPH
jgi:TolB-like protein/DNA-binding winged helix-turn-helix (wHTH) protein/Tfp pilus assembly protein PilF